MTADEAPETFGLEIPTLRTERLVLRAPRQDDFEVFAAFYAGPRSHFVGGPLTRELAWRMLAMEAGHWQLRGFGRWIVEERASGQAVGLVGLFEPEGWPEPELGWDLFDGHEGKGFATEAAEAGRAFAYDVLGWTTLISLVKPKNEASARVATRLGCRRDGEFVHERHGPMRIFRHPAPDALADGGMEAYA
ncbi:GNAT family N-acetyltransferase [Seohaeicola zhoushanensis]|uniref:GNAT family acetyltransferase n=1 Tax=Seohaeicola zhoushanensis TaxID=1569283 RepID=A0A8J3H069_9RHOB|nr:GNAT family N-acetyltransferase [Seohaeicola zhoushanensis]GHF57724.1 GNAT family acetyltransferase [Seohaeicola zhoushanensis]